MNTISSKFSYLINLSQNRNYSLISKNLTNFNKVNKNNNIDFIDRAIKINSIDEPEEYRTLYIENLPLDWDENEIQLRFEQIGNIRNLHLIKNTLGDSLGKGINIKF